MYVKVIIVSELCLNLHLIYIYTYASTCNLIRKFNAKWHLLFRLYKILIIIANLKHYYELCFVSFFIM